MEIELPPGADFGVEASGKFILLSINFCPRKSFGFLLSICAGKQASKQRATLETNADKVKKSNREAARLVAEMFSVLSSTSIAIFPSESEASDARIKWGSTFKGQVFSIDAPAGGKSSGNLYSKRKSPQEQEQALLGSDGVYIPEGTQLIIVAGPRAKDIKKLKKIHERLGEETLIIFINARASIAAASTSAKRSASATIDSDVESDNDDWVTGAFTPVFHYAPPLINVAESEAGLKGKDTKRELLLYHEYGGDWYLAEKEVSEGLFGTGISLPGNSGFKTLWEGKARPQKEELINSLKIAK